MSLVALEEAENAPKRERCPETWKKSVRKQARLHNKEYITEKDLVNSKATGPDYCTYVSYIRVYFIK